MNYLFQVQTLFETRNKMIKYRSNFVEQFLKCALLSLLFYASTNGHRWLGNPAAFIMEPSQINYRLPNNTKPESYNIRVSTYIERNDFSFSGRVAIKLRVLEASYNITIHARQLDIKSIKLATSFGVMIHLNPHTHDNVTDHLVIPTQVQLQKDIQYVLTMEYSGVLRTDLMGFYRNTYINAKGETKKVDLIFCVFLEIFFGKIDFSRFCYILGGWQQQILNHWMPDMHFHAMMNRHSKPNLLLKLNMTNLITQSPI